ncbi:MAG TPA: ribonuclease J [Candidatus Aphodocola excrementigallinarum]|uniref:Ribonuclease J n=1 Tax=Candidatus Aphodocola excrementigallinarum TaxID=2840670 RepID=A0A9D1IPR6_9FIRM|nr:ribonuclease J [Candidatus Aphodocola excrementigallinarum]
MKNLNKNDSETLVVALGGLGEIGKNCYAIMHDDEIIVIDAGVMFPKDELMGIDYVIPDYTFLKENESKVKALFITHGHEDHIGGVAYLLQQVNIPVIYAPNQACGLIKRKLLDKNISYDNLKVYNEDTVVKFKHFTVEFFATTHSIPDSHGIIVTTPNGKIVETGDFKFDLTPIGPMSDIHKMSDTGKSGVRLLMSESTNALSPGFSASESKVEEELQEIFEKKKKGRIIVATFASNIYRLKHIVETCKKYNRKVALFGRSMENNIEISIEGGYIKDDKIFVSPEVANTLAPEEVCLLCTGSQGEPLAALSRIANGTHKQIKLRPTDTVIFSSNPIPGNNASVAKTINQLYLQGVDVYVNNQENEIHTSGHANEEELKLMIRLIDPEYFMPIHGEYRMLKAHQDLAVDCDIPKEKTFLLENGDVLALTKDKVYKKGNIQADDIYVDGNRIGDIKNVVIKDRKIMANDGILVAICNINISEHKLLGKINITTRGFILVNENEALLNEIEQVAENTVNKELTKKNVNYNELKSQMISDILSFVYEKTGRRPIILPVILDIKK